MDVKISNTVACSFSSVLPFNAEIKKRWKSCCVSVYLTFWRFGTFVKRQKNWINSRGALIGWYVKKFNVKQAHWNEDRPAQILDNSKILNQNNFLGYFPENSPRFFLMKSICMLFVVFFMLFQLEMDFAIKKRLLPMEHHV